MTLQDGRGGRCTRLKVPNNSDLDNRVHCNIRFGQIRKQQDKISNAKSILFLIVFMYLYYNFPIPLLTPKPILIITVLH